MSYKLEKLKELFKIKDFYDVQKEIILSILNKRNTIAILPTGGGKSICFQIPALIFEGLTIVVSPLISLIKEQVENLKKRYGILECDYISSDRSKEEIENILKFLSNLKILYVTPERLSSKKFLQNIPSKISMLTIDEAHCISMWGNSFRKSYLQIVKFIKKVKIGVISAFTATANEKIINNIIFHLDIKNPAIFKKPAYRENLKIRINFCANKIKVFESLINPNENS